jgi:hypothetical protein
MLISVLGVIFAAALAALIRPAGAQTGNRGESPPAPVTVYLQVSDARFDSYLYVKRTISGDNEAPSSDQFFYIPPSNSKGREKELAEWRRRFRLIVSAATLSERVQPKISQIKEEFSRADRAVECAMTDHEKERRITVTMIGSASDSAIAREYRAAGREFFADPRQFTCKYMYKLTPSIPQ